MHVLKIKWDFDSKSGNCRDTEQRRYVTSTQLGYYKRNCMYINNKLRHVDPLLGNDPYTRSRGTRHLRGDVTQQYKRRCKLCSLFSSVSNIRGLNLAVVKPTTVQVTKLPL
jgi:hypothetical protein